jgi:hypothetical protein
MAQSGNPAMPIPTPPTSDTSAATGEGPVESGARLLPLRVGFYAFRLLSPDRDGVATAPSSIAVVQICAMPGSAALEITNEGGRDEPWLTSAKRVFVAAPPGGATALLTGYRPRGGDIEPIEIEVRRLDRNGVGDTAGQSSSSGKITDLMNCEALVLGLAPARLADVPGILPFEATAVLHGAGEIGFLDTGWIGRLGRGRWIESFTLTPRGSLAASPVEYKALTADGEETAWIGSGSACRTAPGLAPLIGFCVRQRPGSGPPVFDCEYSGYFQSGTVSRTARNGAPCISPGSNDPLEGIRVRMIPRAPPIGTRPSG